MHAATAPSLPYCMTTCDGCGHCGAGVPPSLRRCFDASDVFVQAALEAHAAHAAEVRREWQSMAINGKQSMAIMHAAEVRRERERAAERRASAEAAYMRDYYRHQNTSHTRWVATVPPPRRAAARARGEIGARGEIDWVTSGAVTQPTSQGRCGTCQSFSCIADVEGAWFLSGHVRAVSTRRARASPQARVWPRAALHSPSPPGRHHPPHISHATLTPPPPPPPVASAPSLGMHACSRSRSSRSSR